MIKILEKLGRVIWGIGKNVVIWRVRSKKCMNCGERSRIRYGVRMKVL